MEIFFTPSIVCVATVTGFVVGMIWYSPILFSKAWMKGEGVTSSQIKKPTPLYMFQTGVYSLIAHGAMASVLALMFDIISVASLSVAVAFALLLGFGFIVTTRFIDMVYNIHAKHYEMRSQLKFLVSSGYYLVLLAVMATVIFLMGSR